MGLNKAVIPLSLYIHFPWCVRKCPYCDFNSHEVRGAVPEDNYLAALIRDLDLALPSAQERPLVSIFIGGGTPSLMAPKTVAALLAAVRARLAVADDVEITLEANPGTVEASHFAGFATAGITRLSVGVQSFDDRHLGALGRIHSADEARRAVDAACRAFDRVNLDLMYALPGQTLTEAERDIATAIALGPTHLSAYHLTVEPNTAFHHAPPTLPDDDLAADMQEAVEAALATAGFQHYETSAFARPGHQCRHNLNYWTFGDYLGIGAGAHAKITWPDHIVREMRHKHPAEYLRSPSFVQEHHEVRAGDLPGEFMMNALRLTEGFAPALFEQRTGQPFDGMPPLLAQAAADGLLTFDEQRIAPTPFGQRHLNALIERFL